MTDKPIAFTEEGRPIFDNTPTVVAVAVTSADGILVIRRAGAVGYGKLGLPGGYHMRGESWQLGGAREVMEETGYLIDPSRLTDRHTLTDSYGNNMIFAKYEGVAVKTDAELDGESLEVLFVKEEDLKPEDWAFPLHYSFAKRMLAEQRLLHPFLLSLLDTDPVDGFGTDHRSLSAGLLNRVMELDPDWRDTLKAIREPLPLEKEDDFEPM